MIKHIGVFALALAVLLPGRAVAYSTAGGAGAAPIKPKRSVLVPPKDRDSMRTRWCYRANSRSSCVHRPPPADRFHGR